MNTEISPLVSIAVTTFNMEAFIAKGLDSWLAQKTSFPIEIVISDDGSEDKTRDIVQDYMKVHSNIRLVCTGHIGKMPNFIRSMQECRGKYVALCDGDDYWIDDYKLQKQFDFMESNPEFSMCFTNSWVLNLETGEKKIAKKQLWDTATTEGLLAHRDNDNVQMSPGHTSTFFFRNGLVDKYPEWMYGDVMTDFPTYMLLSRYGKAKFINEITSVYNHRLEGVSSKGWNPITSTKRRIFVYENVNRDFNYRYRRIIKPILADYYWGLGKHIYKNRSKLESLVYFLKTFCYNPRIIFTYVLKKYLNHGRQDC